MDILIKWAIFNVCVALLTPLTVSLVKANSALSLSEFWQSFSTSQEILVLSSALLADGAGDMIFSKNKDLINQFLTGVCILGIIFTVALSFSHTPSFSNYSAPDPDYGYMRNRRERYSPEPITNQPIFIGSLIVSGCCKFRVKWEEEINGKRKTRR